MKKILTIVWVTCLMVFVSGLVMAREIVVCSEAGDGCDYTSIQTAIDNAADGDTITIGPGVYNEHDITIENKSLTLQGADPQNTVINAQGLGSGLVIKSVNVNAARNVSIANLQIRGGSATNGAGVYIVHNDYGDTLTVYLQNLYILGNLASDMGGGVYAYVANGDLKVSIEDSNISKNSATNYGGGIYLEGGTLNITGTTIEGNSASLAGGGIYTDDDTSLNVSNTIVKDNTSAGPGGGLLIGEKASITKSWIVNNRSSEEGGGIDLNDKLPVTMNLFSSVVAYNHSQTKGGGLAIGSESHYYNGDHSVIINSSTIAYNTCDDVKNGEGIFVASGENDAPVNLQLLNSVLAHDNVDLAFEKDDNDVAYGTFIFKNNAFVHKLTLPATINLQESNDFLAPGPFFEDPADFDFSLEESSNLIDKADEAGAYIEDIAGTIRTGTPDIGACEYPSTCKMTELAPVVINTGDFNATVVTAEINISCGWNLVALPGYKEIKIADVFEDNLNKIQAIWLWDRITSSWKLYTANETIKQILSALPSSIKLVDVNTVLQPGQGFWVKSDANFKLLFTGYEELE